MASHVYPLALKAFLDKDIDLLVDDIKAVMVDTALYTYDAAHQFLSVVAGGAQVATSGVLTGKTTTGGVFNADDITLTAVSGASCEAVIIFRADGGGAGASQLLAYMEPAVPFTPNGSDVLLQWNAGGIFSI